MNNKKFLPILLIAFLVGIATAVTYTWWSGERLIIGGEVTAVVSWSGAAEVGQLETITVSITNTKATTSTGILNVKIYTTDIEPLPPATADLGDQEVTVLSGATIDYIYTWTPEVAGSYYALATYAEN